MRTHFCVLEASVPTSKRSFDDLRFSLNFAYTRGALGTTGMLFSKEFVRSMSQQATMDAPAKVILVRIQPMEVTAGTHSVAQLTRSRAHSILTFVISVFLIPERRDAS
jgi:hypothetical protein